MEHIKGINFAPFPCKGNLETESAFRSLEELKKRTNANTVIFVPNGLQDTAHSEEIVFDSCANVTDKELITMIHFAHDLGLQVILKPTVNCKNGTWRAHINFFDEDVVCEPKWSNWFVSYTRFQLHYAKIAELTKCEMFIPGCEMVMAERREAEWRTLIGEIRNCYNGLISYNADKYQEHNITWWDCVDVISSSGYYPINDWEVQLDRIETVVKKYQKPFFFAEVGCMSVVGAEQVPNNWNLKGDIDVSTQKRWYEEMFAACSKRTWISGYGIWEWCSKLYQEKNAISDGGYEVFGKPAEEIISKNFKEL